MLSTLKSSIVVGAAAIASAALAEPNPPIQGFVKGQSIAVGGYACTVEGSVSRCAYLTAGDYADGLNNYAFTNVAGDVLVTDYSTGAFSQRWISCAVGRGAVLADRHGASLAARLDPAGGNCFTGGYDYDPVNGYAYHPGYTSPVDVAARSSNARVVADGTQITKYEAAPLYGASYSQREQCHFGNHHGADIEFSIAGDAGRSQEGTWTWRNCHIVARN